MMSSHFSHISRQGRNIAIIGAGQAGLQIGIGLLKANPYNKISLFTNKTAEQIYNGPILSSQGMFGSAINIEKQLELNYWDNICPANQTVSFNLIDPETTQLITKWKGLTTQPYQSVDQRLKFSKWQEIFVSLGGNLSVQEVNLNELNKITDSHELTLVAGGKSGISQSFQKNPHRSCFNKPQRILSCLYLKGVAPIEGPGGVHVHILPGIGEVFIMPGLTKNGPCEMLLLEGIPEGPLDCWSSLLTAEERHKKALEFLQKFLPSLWERCQASQVTDDQATLVGAYTPIVRYPTFKLPCGKFVLGIGDTVLLNDPIAGQGANNACKAAYIYMNRITEHDEQDFSDEWMQETFEIYWRQHGLWSTQWSHMLLMPPPPYLMEMIQSASHSPEIANTLANGFDDPSTLFPWFNNTENALNVMCSIKHED
jgi:hypothetical protein